MNGWDAVSRSPPIPQMVLITKRPSSVAAPLTFAWSRQLTKRIGEGDICEKVTDAYPGFLGNDRAIALGHGFEHPEVEFVVEMVHGPVEGLQGIGNPRSLLLHPPPRRNREPPDRRLPPSAGFVGISADFTDSGGGDGAAVSSLTSTLYVIGVLISLISPISQVVAEGAAPSRTRPRPVGVKGVQRMAQRKRRHRGCGRSPRQEARAAEGRIGTISLHEPSAPAFMGSYCSFTFFRRVSSNCSGVFFARMSLNWVR